MKQTDIMQDKMLRSAGCNLLVSRWSPFATFHSLRACATNSAENCSAPSCFDRATSLLSKEFGTRYVPRREQP